LAWRSWLVRVRFAGCVGCEPIIPIAYASDANPPRGTIWDLLSAERVEAVVPGQDREPGGDIRVPILGMNREVAFSRRIRILFISSRHLRISLMP
jgi:hypothetical protein